MDMEKFYPTELHCNMRDAVRIAGLSRPTLFNRVADKTLKGHQFGNRRDWYFLISDVLKLKYRNNNVRR